jgi:hypothetical protein
MIRASPAMVPSGTVPGPTPAGQGRPVPHQVEVQADACPGGDGVDAGPPGVAQVAEHGRPDQVPRGPGGSQGQGREQQQADGRVHPAGPAPDPDHGRHDRRDQDQRAARPSSHPASPWSRDRASTHPARARGGGPAARVALERVPAPGQGRHPGGEQGPGRAPPKWTSRERGRRGRSAPVPAPAPAPEATAVRATGAGQQGPSARPGRRWPGRSPRPAGASRSTSSHKAKQQQRPPPPRPCRRGSRRRRTAPG